MIYIILFALLIIFLSTKITKKHKQKNVQENWRNYYKNHPNTNIYYQPRRPQYREYNNQSGTDSTIPWKFIIFIIIALVIISKIA